MYMNKVEHFKLAQSRAMTVASEHLHGKHHEDKY
jgi:hypothetical protein